MTYTIDPSAEPKIRYEDAAKQVKAEKPKENMMVIPFGYDYKIVVPYKDGVKIIEALANAEVLKEEYGELPHFTGIERHHLNPTLMPRDEYELIKLAGVLRVDYRELKKHRK